MSMSACATTIAEFTQAPTAEHVRIHGLRARVSGHRTHIAMHVLVPGSWTVQRGHDLLEDIEDRLHEQIEHLDVDTHLEPIEDPRAYEVGVESELRQ